MNDHCPQNMQQYEQNEIIANAFQISQLSDTDIIELCNILYNPNELQNNYVSMDTTVKKRKNNFNKKI